MAREGTRECPVCRLRVKTRDGKDGKRYYSQHKDENNRVCPQSGIRSR